MYLCVVIIFSVQVYKGLYFLPIPLESWVIVSVFFVFSVSSMF